MEQINNIINILLTNFDISYMLSINILTYLNKEKKLKLIYKRLVLILSTIICCVLYKYTTDITNYVLINSTIAAPVFYSWVIKPILNKYNISYKK